jgi:hypothetical protein
MARVSGIVVHTCNPSTQKAKAGGLQVPGQPGLYGKTLSQKKKFLYFLLGS